MAGVIVITLFLAPSVAAASFIWHIKLAQRQLSFLACNVAPASTRVFWGGSKQHACTSKQSSTRSYSFAGQALLSALRHCDNGCS